MISGMEVVEGLIRLLCTRRRLREEGVGYLRNLQMIFDGRSARLSYVVSRKSDIKRPTCQ